MLPFSLLSGTSPVGGPAEVKSAVPSAPSVCVCPAFQDLGLGHEETWTPVALRRPPLLPERSAMATPIHR